MMIAGSRAKALRNILGDALYRGSLYLLANTVATSAIGFVFWTLAAHRYSPSTLGVFSGITSGASLLAAVAALGLPITMTRHIARAQDPREFVLASVIIISTAGTVLCLATVIFLGPYLPSALHIQQRGNMTFILTAIVVFTAVSGTLDAGLVAIRSSRVVLYKNLFGSFVKLTAMLLLATLHSAGLFIAFGLGLILSTLISGAALFWRTKGDGDNPGHFTFPWRYLSITSGNYAATVIGILPLTCVPIEVFAVRGAAETARFSIAFLIAGFLNFIPSTMGQVLFAELARGGVPLGKQLRKARYAVYGLLLPSIAVLLVAAPFILRLFGESYATDATGCLRMLALSALPAGGTYLVDSILIARDRTAAYTFMQISNAALVLGGVGVLLPRGLTAAAGGLGLAQVATLLLGLLVIATGRVGRHRIGEEIAQLESSLPYGVNDVPSPLAIHTVEPQIRELLAVWPMMPTILIAEQLGWNESIQTLQERVAELRFAYSQHNQRLHETGYLAGETAQCSLWFPPVKIPVGAGQTRSASQLPVLVMVTGYSRWMSAVLIPSRRAEDLLAGWWQLINELEAVPHSLIWHYEDAIGQETDGAPWITDECRRFIHSLNTMVMVGGTDDPATTDLTERVETYFERSFLPERIFESPAHFNTELRCWLEIANKQRGRWANESPASLIAADRRAMLPLPAVPPATGWRMRVEVKRGSIIHFDSNAYPVPSALIGRVVEVVADLSRVRVLCDGKIAAQYRRAWTREQTVRDTVHGTALS